MLSASLSPQSFPDTAMKLAPGTRVVDVEILDSKNNLISIAGLTEEEELEITIPKSLNKEGNNTLPGGMKARGHSLSQAQRPTLFM